MLSFALVFVSVTMASVVALFGEERRVKLWFVTTCIACGTLSAGVWVEVHQPDWTIVAARVNMTVALALAASGLLATLAITRMPVSRTILAVLAGAGLINIATVWASDLYFSGQILHYPWGIYVGANPWFVANPLLVTLIAGYAAVLLARNYRHAHPLEKNRAKYLFAAYTILALSVIDYLPHFGIDPFGAPIGGVFVALFLFLFGYACLRYRLVVFRDLVGRALGWGIAFGAMALAYAFAIEAARRFGASAYSTSPLIGTIAAGGVYAALGRTLPDWTERVFGVREPDYAGAIRDYSDAITSNFDEQQVIAATTTMCTDTFGTSLSAYLESTALERDNVLPVLQGPYVEVEVLRRRHALSSSIYDLFLPISRHGAIVGALAIGPRSDGRMYSPRALEALRTLANVLGIAIANARGAAELLLVNDELRRQVTDRSRQLAEALQRVGAIPTRDSDIRVGKVIDDRYEVVRELGKGGMGAVFEVVRTRDGRRFALKVLRLAHTGVSLARFAREAEVAGKITHPNLVSIVDVNVSARGELYLVMELVEGSPLSDAQERFGDIAWALPILRQIARGLSALHAGGVVHRDLKPGNVLLSRDPLAPHVKIADFGLARLSRAPTNPVVDAASDSKIASAPTLAPIESAPTLAASGSGESADLTQHGEVMGTPLYMAPELVNGARDAPASSDIWSLGVVAYLLLVGELPAKTGFTRITSEARAMAEAEFCAIASLPAKTAEALARTLAIDPNERPSAAELVDVLAAPVAAPTSSASPTAS